MGRNSRSGGFNTNYVCLELNEGNVQSIFNRCLAKQNSQETTGSCLYFRALGYEKEDTGISFDKKEIFLNKKNIEYLYGQLKPIHITQNILTIEDFSKIYFGTDWTQDKASLMQLIYLGSSEDFRILSPFVAKNNGTTLLFPVKPTLSPKDPNFPAWWEEHKSEWEEPKKEGKEPFED